MPRLGTVSSGRFGGRLGKNRGLVTNLTPTFRISGIGPNPNAGIGMTKSTFDISCSITSSTTGILYETGGSGWGVVIYMYNGTLYAQAGSGTTGVGEVELSYTLGTTSVRNIMFSADSANKAQLYVNSNLISEMSGLNFTYLHGGDVGGTGAVYSSVAATRAFPVNSTDTALTNLTNGTLWTTQVFQGMTVFSVVASGGTVTTSGAYTIHTFTASETFTLTSNPQNRSFIVLVVGGGGGGGTRHGGGGGAGGVLYNDTFTAMLGPYTVTVGAGGGAATSGSNSTFSTLTAIGGGRGGGGGVVVQSGGSGGGQDGGSIGGSGTAGQGNTGGFGSGGPSESYFSGGGGGGAAAVGGNSTQVQFATAGNGGSGRSLSISGSAVYYGGGGGGGCASTSTSAGSGGLGGGGAGSIGAVNATSGTANTGGGGGGSGFVSGSNGVPGSGGSGIVIIAYLTS